MEYVRQVCNLYRRPSSEIANLVVLTVYALSILPLRAFEDCTRKSDRPEMCQHRDLEGGTSLEFRYLKYAITLPGGVCHKL
jgi:hypothetical protein